MEHPFHVVKNLFGHRKVRYRGLAKNEAHMYALFGLGLTRLICTPITPNLPAPPTLGRQLLCSDAPGLGVEPDFGSLGDPVAVFE